MHNSGFQNEKSKITLCVDPARKDEILKPAIKFLKNKLKPTTPNQVEEAMGAAFTHVNQRFREYSGLTTDFRRVVLNGIINDDLIEAPVRMFFTFNRTVAMDAISLMVKQFSTETR